LYSVPALQQNNINSSVSTSAIDPVFGPFLLGSLEYIG
jgi:hypothetical protein